VEHNSLSGPEEEDVFHNTSSCNVHDFCMYYIPRLKQCGNGIGYKLRILCWIDDDFILCNIVLPLASLQVPAAL
jgi:hypothetical protein